jgi:hypothetical protein
MYRFSPFRFAACGMSNRDASRHATGDFQQVGLHVDDLVLAVPVAGKEVLQAVGLEPDGAVDEAVLVGAGVTEDFRGFGVIVLEGWIAAARITPPATASIVCRIDGGTSRKSIHHRLASNPG